jgi:predicted transcriptional regulator
MTKPPDEVLTVRVPPQLKRQLKRLAGEDQRTISNLVEVLLTQALQARQATKEPVSA